MSLNLPILEGTEIIELLGLKTYEVDNPKTFHKLQDVTNYFKDLPNARYKMLKILSNKNGDKMDILWTYVALKKEQLAAVQELNPEFFGKDIVAEITEGYVTKPVRNRIKEDIQKRIKQQEQEKKHNQQTEKAMDKVSSSLPKIKDTLDKLDFLDKELDAYG